MIEQTDDADFVEKGDEAFNEVLNQYGLKRGEAYRYSVSSASAIGPMQFTNRRGNGTYALVVRRCPAAKLEPNFERGATDLLNAMKAAICLFDIELKQMRPEIRGAYRDNREVLGIFPVAAYNGGPRNVTKLASVMKKMKVGLTELGRPGEQPAKPVPCPCVWKTVASDVIPVSIPRYNNENRWYIEKYQSILSVFEEGEAASLRVAFASTDAADPYLWLEEIDSARALEWVRAKNAETTKKLESQPIYQELPANAGGARLRLAAAGGRAARQVDLQLLEGRRAPARHLPARHAGRAPQARAGVADGARRRRARGREKQALGLPRHGLPAAGVQVPGVALARRRRRRGDPRIRQETSPSCPAASRCRPPRPTSPGATPTASSSARTSVPARSPTRATRAKSSCGSAARRSPGAHDPTRQAGIGGRRRLPPALRRRRRRPGQRGRTFWETDYHQLSARSCKARPARHRASRRLFRGQLIVELKEDWQRGERRYAQDSVLIADPARARRREAAPRRPRGAGGTAAQRSGRGRGGEERHPRHHARQRAGSSLSLRAEAASGWPRRQIPFPDNGRLDDRLGGPHSGDAFVKYEEFVTPPTLYYVADPNPVPEQVKQQHRPSTAAASR